MTTIADYTWSKTEAAAIKAVWAEPQGRIALLLIVERLGLLHADSFDKDPAVMAHIAGRRYVARQLMAVINQPLDKIVKEPHEPRTSRPISATERAEQLAAGQQPGSAAGAGAVAAARQRLKR